MDITKIPSLFHRPAGNPLHQALAALRVDLRRHHRLDPMDLTNNLRLMATMGRAVALQATVILPIVDMLGIHTEETMETHTVPREIHTGDITEATKKVSS